MHGLLACAALHKGQTILATTHQGISMPLFRHAVSNVNTHNCHAILAFSHLLCVYCFASERHESFFGETTWLHFLRGGCSMLCSVWDKIENGPIKGLALVWDIPFPKSADKRALIPLPEDSSPQFDICRSAAVELGWALVYADDLGESITTWDALRVWPMRISSDFMKLLGERHYGAMILLAHYCKILNRIDALWYFDGLASQLMSTIISNLDEKWYSYILEPLREVGQQA